MSPFGFPSTFIFFPSFLFCSKTWLFFQTIRFGRHFKLVTLMRKTLRRFRVEPHSRSQYPYLSMTLRMIRYLINCRQFIPVYKLAFGMLSFQLALELEKYQEYWFLSDLLKLSSIKVLPSQTFISEGWPSFCFLLRLKRQHQGFQ